MSINDLAPMILKHRRNMNVRATAKEIGISPTTFCRVARGAVPDQKTLTKICKWLKEDPDRFTEFGKLGSKYEEGPRPQVKNASDLAELIIKASKRFAEIDAIGH